MLASALAAKQQVDESDSDGVFGSLITWMQEKTSPVFIGRRGSANNVQILPAQLLRKGRFDEIFFLNLPNEVERQEIQSQPSTPTKP